MNGGKLILSLEIVEMVISLIIIGLCLLQIKSGTGLGTIAGTEVELTTITPKEVG